MKYRIEKDTMGEVKVPFDKFWGAQTERSRNNFRIGPESSMPLEIIYGFAILKKSAAHADALATAFNVMTTNSAIKLANENNLAVLFIVQDSDYLNFIYTDAWYYSKYE